MDSNFPNFLVSIQCITYNQASYIEDAMNGFCMQQTTFPYVSIIIDDASTDGEPDVIRGYLNTHFNMTEAREWETDDAKFFYARHKENKNCYFAVILLKYNFYSIKKAKEPLYSEFEKTAKYIALCEGDDYWTYINKLQMQVDFMEKHTGYSMCFHSVLEKLENNVVTDLDHTEMPQLEERNYEGKEIIQSWLVPTCSVVFNTKALDCSNFRKRRKNTNYIYGDIILFLSLAEVGALYCMSTFPMAVYRRHQGSATMRIRGNYEPQIRHLETLKKDFGGKYVKECNSNISWLSFDYFTINIFEKNIFKGIKYLIKSFLANHKTAWKLLRKLLLSKI